MYWQGTIYKTQATVSSNPRADCWEVTAWAMVRVERRNPAPQHMMSNIVPPSEKAALHMSPSHLRRVMSVLDFLKTVLSHCGFKFLTSCPMALLL